LNINGAQKWPTHSLLAGRDNISATLRLILRPAQARRTVQDHVKQIIQSISGKQPQTASRIKNLLPQISERTQTSKDIKTKLQRLINDS
jgi:type I site-specific restriction-modification system R (restriction) subunit